MLSEVSADTELPKLESVPLKASCITAGGAPIQISISAEKRFVPDCQNVVTYSTHFYSFSLTFHTKPFDNTIKSVRSK